MARDSAVVGSHPVPLRRRWFFLAGAAGSLILLVAWLGSLPFEFRRQYVHHVSDRVEVAVGAGRIAYRAWPSSLILPPGWLPWSVTWAREWPFWPHMRPGEWESDYSIPLWLPFLAFAIPTAFFRRFALRQPAGHCQRCGYDLTGNVSGRCPECGVAA